FLGRHRNPRRSRVLPDRRHFEDAERLRRLAFQLESWHLVDGDVVLAGLIRGPSDEDMKRRRGAAEARPGVHCVAERRVLKTVLAAHVADDSWTGVDADAPAHRR